MNKYVLHIAGGALLASTALASGTVSAATLKYVQAAGGISGTAAAAGSALASLATPTGLASNIVGGTTGSSISIGPGTIVIDASNAALITGGSTIQINVVGAEFDLTGTIATELWSNESSSSASLTSLTTIGATAFVTSDKITLTNITALTWGALVLSNLKFRNAQGLATVGAVVSLNGSIYNSAGTLVLETITSANILNSRLGSAIEVTAGAAVSANVTITTGAQFASITQSGVVSNSAVLSYVKFTDNLGVGAGLITTTSANLLLSTYEVKLTHALLSDTSPLSTTSAVQYNSAAANVARTAGVFVSGTVTYTLAGITAGTLTTTLSANWAGATAIAASAAGTTVVTATATASNLTGYSVITGTAPAITRGGMTAYVNYVNPSNNTMLSYIRVTNSGSTAGAVTLAIRNASSGASIGTYTSPSIAAGATLQISASSMESQSVPAITPAAGVQYDVTITGSVTGFVQHIGFITATQVATDLSSMRIGGSGHVQ